MSQFSFPILNDDELLPCMDEMELPLDAQQLAKPTYEIVRPLFEAILTSLTGVAREELNQPVFAAIDAFEYPELHDESVPCLNFFRHLGKLMAASGVKDFGLKDVHKPDSARLRRHLSAVVNFAKLREEKLVAYTEMQARIDSLLEEKRMLEEENAGKMEALDRCQAERAAEQEEASKVEAEALAIYQQNQQLNKQQLGLHSEVKALKAQANQLADQAAQQKFELMNAQQENERLQSQIVQSPEKFQKALADLQQAVEQERLLVAESERMSRDLQSKLDVVQKVEKEVSKCQRLMDELDEEVGRKKEVSRRVKELRAQISAYDHEATQLAATQQHLKRQQASLLERIQRLEHQAALKMDAAESYVEQQQKEKEMVEAENAAMDARLLENEAQMRSLSERIKELQATHDAQVANVMDKYSGLRRTVGEYNSTLMQAVGSSRGAIALEALDVNAMVA